MRASRRGFIVGAGLSAAGAATPAPAIAQSAPEVHWKLTSAFTPTLDLIYGGASQSAVAELLVQMQIRCATQWDGWGWKDE